MKTADELNLRPIGRGFIIHEPIQGGPAGRSLVMAYIDSNNKKYIELNGKITPLEKNHGFVAVD